MENSPFGQRSGLTSRSPPPTPPSLPPKTRDEVATADIVSTSEIQNWMSQINQHLNEVCLIASEGKLNTDQKLKINNLCRKVGHGTANLAVMYQSLKQKAIVANFTIQGLKENQDLANCLLDIKDTIVETRPKPVPAATFANAVKKSSNSFLRPVALSSVAIYPNDKQKTSNETKNVIQKLISPEEMKLQVRGLRKTRNGGVIISTEKKDDIQKLKETVQKSTLGLTVDEPQKRRPRIIIIGVPTSLPENEVYKCIFEQNLTEKIPSLTLDAYLDLIKLSHKSGKKGTESCNYIIEVPANIRKALISQDRVFINWSSCPIRDFTLVTRCFNCHKYGHAAKTCKEEKPTCGHCGDLGHKSNECTKNAEPPKCATCLRFKKPSNHKTGDNDCPAKKNAEYGYINSIDYDGA